MKTIDSRIVGIIGAGIVRGHPVAPKKEKRQIDWKVIYCEYRAGILSVREIATIHGVSHVAIIKRAKKAPDKWKRDLTQKVRAEVARRMVTEEVTTADESEIIEEAAERTFAIIKKHRKCLARLAELEAKLLAELHDNPIKLWIGQYMGKIITKEVPIPLTERAAALLALVNAMSKRIKMERQAFGIADHFKPQQEEVTEIRIICVAAPNREDEYEPPKQIPNEARLLLPGEKL